VAVVIALRGNDDTLDAPAQQVGYKAHFPVVVAAGVDQHDGQAILLDDLPIPRASCE